MIPLDVVVARLDETQAGDAIDLLSVDERSRARRFAFARDRNRYITCRAYLRRLLSERLGVAPQLIGIEVAAYGKPVLADPDSRLCFSIAHSNDVAVFGFAVGHEIGVDVEALETRVDRDRIAESFFSPAEHAAYLALDEAERPAGFVNCWTRKEAFIKAIGEGLHCALHSFDVSVCPYDGARILRTPAGHGSPADWALVSFTPCPGYVASVAIDRRPLMPGHASQSCFGDGACVSV